MHNLYSDIFFQEKTHFYLYRPVSTLLRKGEKKNFRSFQMYF